MTSNFEIGSTFGAGRTGVFQTRSGKSIRTPCFAPVGTAGAIKGITTADLPENGFDLLLANTYHLMLRPGADTVEALGGVHRMLNWDGALLTDSGGFQVFSLAAIRRIDAEGVTFNNHIDGAELRLTPDIVVQAQESFGSDIAMVLDVCPALPGTAAEIRDAVETSIGWARLALEARTRETMDLFGIVQGGTHPDLRAFSAQETVALGFDGYAIGGLSVGESARDLYATLEVTTPCLPTDQIRYLMGVGRPDNIVEAVARGVDLFDCVLPTRNARNGKLMTTNGFLNIQREEFARSTQPIEADCPCPTCTTTSRGLLRHLFKSKELNYYRHATVHNLWYMATLLANVRASLADGSFDELRAQVVACYSPDEE